MSAIGGVMSGSIGVQGHYANGLAALFIACGQDAACVAEAAVGVTRFEASEDGGAVCVGHAAEPDRRHGRRRHRLPSQRACLDILGLAGRRARARVRRSRGRARAGRRAVDHRRARRRALHRAHQRLARAPPASPMNRWLVYQRERFPLPATDRWSRRSARRRSASRRSFRGHVAGLPRQAGRSVAFVTALLFFLQLRIADEFKDFEDDARYRPYRPVPRGLVTLRELGVVASRAGASNWRWRSGSTRR